MRAELLNSRPAKWSALLGLILVPVLVAGGFLLAGLNSTQRLAQVQAAVVNLDEPVTVNGQYTPLGRQLTANLVDSDRTENLNWVLANQVDAEAGLNTGKFAAMVVIPKNFSAAATSFSANDPAKAEQATIKVHTSPVAGVADATLGKIVAIEATTALNQMLTKEYLNQIYIGFGDLGDQFVTLADGSAELADGLNQLSDGIDTAAEGSGKLHDGADQLASGLKTLHGKTADLPSGTRKLATGLEQVAQGTKELPDGSRALADGLGQLASQTKGLPAGSAELATGLENYVAGVNQVVDSNIAALPQQAALAQGIFDLAAGASGLHGGLKAYQKAMDDLGDNDGVVGQATQGAIQAIGGIDCPAELEAIPGGCQAFAAGLKAGAQVGAKVGVTVGGKAAAAGLDQGLLGGAAQLAGGLGELSDQLSGSVPSPDAVDAQIKQLKQLKAGGIQLAGGAQELASGMPALAGGISQLAAGADELAAGMPALHSGLNQLAAGADQLADGMPALHSGIGQLSDGADKLADGVGELNSGLVDAASGSGKLADGMQKMADGLAEGKDQIPSFSESNSESLAQVVAAPVSTTDLAGLANVNIGWISLVLVLALWAGALATYTVVRATGSGLLESTDSTALLIGKSLLPGVIVAAAQAIVIAGMAQPGLGLSAQKWFAVTAVLLLSGVTFAVLNHALAAWLGGLGRLIAVGMAVLTTADALSAAAPSTLSALAPFSPLSPALNAVRAIVTESAGANAYTLVVVGWLVAGLAASSIAVARKRTVSLAAVLAQA